MILSQVFDTAASLLSPAKYGSEDDVCPAHAATAVFIACGVAHDSSDAEPGSTKAALYHKAVAFAVERGFPLLNAFAYADIPPGIERQSAIFDGLTLLSILAEEEGV